MVRRISTADQSQSEQRRLTITTMVIGGGTMDLVINDYVYSTSHVDAYIEPAHRFHDGFIIADDDILLQMIQVVLLPAFENALTNLGMPGLKLALARLMVSEMLDVRDSILRQQLVVQLIYPAGYLTTNTG